MVNFIHDATTTQFVLAIIAVVSLIMIILQGFIRHAVWNGYLVLFFVCGIWLLVTLR